MAIISKEQAREWVDDTEVQEDESEMLPNLKKNESVDGKKVIRKKKGLGYGSD